MSKQIMVLGEINTSDVCSVLASAGYQICDSLSVDALKKSQCLVVSASGFEKMNQIIERIRLQVALPIVMVYQELSFEDKKKLVESGVAGFVQKQFIDGTLLDEIGFAQIRNECSNQTEKIIRELKQKLEDRRIIDQAKGVLIQQGLTEKDAYQLMRKTSMNQRIPLQEVAQALLVSKKISEEDN